MGFWSKLMGREQDFVFSEDRPSPQLRKALQDAGEQPLNDLTWRIVLASPQRSWTFDITLFQADAGFTAYDRGGRQKARLNAASIVLAAIKGGSIDDGTLASASLAFFDTDFTVGANKGKTHATAWNTLALDAKSPDGQLRVARSAHRLTFPVGRVSLDFVDALKLFE